MARALIVAGEMQLPSEREDQRHGVLGYGGGVHALRAGEPDTCNLEGVTRILVGARTDRLDESESWRALDQFIAPQHRDTQHIGLADARDKLIERVDLKMLDV